MSDVLKHLRDYLRTRSTKGGSSKPGKPGKKKGNQGTKGPRKSK